MDTVAELLMWWLAGLFGSAIFLEFGIRREGMDIDVGDLMFGFIVSLGGALMLLASLALFLMPWAFRRFIDTSRVIFPKSKERQ